jgi:hypothetical protein
LEGYFHFTASEAICEQEIIGLIRNLSEQGKKTRLTEGAANLGQLDLHEMDTKSISE